MGVKLVRAMGCGDATTGEGPMAGAELRYCMGLKGVVGWAMSLEGPSLDSGGLTLRSSVPRKFKKMELA